MNVRVRLFAAARQIVGRETVEVALPPGGTVAQLRRSLAREYPQLAGLIESSLLALDAEYAPETSEIRPGCQIACIPPVSGG
jgi:sulfur-carrier protein